MFFQRSCTQLKALTDFSSFQFTSRGIAGSSTREVRFISQDEPGIYNLDFIDLSASGEPLTMIADNGDISKVLSMIILIVELYTERYPNRTIRFKGETREKAHLFRVALDMHIEKLLMLFDIALEKQRPLFPLHIHSRESIDNIAFLLKRRPGPSFSIQALQATMNSRSLIFGNSVSVELLSDEEVEAE